MYLLVCFIYKGELCVHWFQKKRRDIFKKIFKISFQIFIYFIIIYSRIIALRNNLPRKYFARLDDIKYIFGILYISLQQTEYFLPHSKIKFKLYSRSYLIEYFSIYSIPN